ncbi:MAG: hypothetical protein FJ218_00430 [Ignavibacteria bacterium]|nr:hypothetical protein [Ignavibacteria bacterium]
MIDKKNLLLLGEEPLLNEWKSFCEMKGFDVVINFHSSQNIFLAIELSLCDVEKKKENLKFLRSLYKNTAILSSSITVTASEQLLWLDKETQLLGISALPTFLSGELIEIASPTNVTKKTWDVVQTFVLQIGKQFSVVQDRVGMVLPRIVCMLVNESFFALQEEIATPEAIDTAMKLGTNYPFGPIEWGEKIGYENVVAVLSALHRELGDDRYRISPLLRQVALEKRIKNTTNDE